MTWYADPVIGYAYGIVDTPLDDQPSGQWNAEMGVEVFDGSTWRQCYSVICSTDAAPNEIDAVWDIQDVTGMQWRLSSPVSGWTTGGVPLGNQSGVIQAMPAGMLGATKSRIDKIKQDYTLLEP